jgi:hypothetical protein
MKLYTMIIKIEAENVKDANAVVDDIQFRHTNEVTKVLDFNLLVEA